MEDFAEEADEVILELDGMGVLELARGEGLGFDGLGDDEGEGTSEVEPEAELEEDPTQRSTLVSSKGRTTPILPKGL